MIKITEKTLDLFYAEVDALVKSKCKLAGHGKFQTMEQVQRNVGQVEGLELAVKTMDRIVSNLRKQKEPMVATT